MFSVLSPAGSHVKDLRERQYSRVILEIYVFYYTQSCRVKS